jgi:membrane protein YdbS with pleckstrin-like domain
MRPDRTFPSRIDGWLVALVGGSAALPLLAAAWLALRGQWAGVVVLALWGGTMTLVVAVLSFPLRYNFWTDRLHIRSGWLSWDIPYAAIRRAEYSRNPLSAPAWSFRRVKITSADGSFILVSPEDRKLFMEELVARCPHLPPELRDTSNLPP